MFVYSARLFAYWLQETTILNQSSCQKLNFAMIYTWHVLRDVRAKISEQQEKSEQKTNCGAAPVNRRPGDIGPPLHSYILQVKCWQIPNLLANWPIIFSRLFPDKQRQLISSADIIDNGHWWKHNSYTEYYKVYY